MTAKRGGRVPRPAANDEWELIFVTGQAATAWEAACNSIPTAMRSCFDHFTTDPRGHSARHHQLKGQLATGEYKSRVLERWQHEITGGGRVWALIDDETKTVRIEAVHLGHPKQTE